MKSITCVTTRYLPNMRHLARLLEADEAVVLDLAALPRRSKDSFVTRNRIAHPAAAQDLWLSVPVLRSHDQPTREATIDATQHRWISQHIGNIRGAYPG